MGYHVYVIYEACSTHIFFLIIYIIILDIIFVFENFNLLSSLVLNFFMSLKLLILWKYKHCTIAKICKNSDFVI